MDHIKNVEIILLMGDVKVGKINVNLEIVLENTLVQQTNGNQLYFVANKIVTLNLQYF